VNWDPLMRLGAHVAAEQDREHEQRRPEDDELREFLARRVAERPSAERRAERARPLPRRWLLPGALLAALLLGGLLLVMDWVSSEPPRGKPLSFTVGGQSGILHAWESAPEDHPLALVFSDGTSIELEPRARARVVAVDSDGAEVVIESGRATVHVVPRTLHPADYRVRMGPFAVEVEGTRFDVGWAPEAEEFSLALFEGRVKVTGCGFGAGSEVPAGFRVEASCQRPGFVLTPVGAGAPDTPEKPELPADETPASLGAADAGAGEYRLREAPEPSRERTPRSGRAKPQPSWQELARAGRFTRAYASAVRAGFDDECERASVEDVVLLGDAARHGGYAGLARRAYSAVRRRAPASRAAADAAFALGRLALDDQDPHEARRWFSTSLDEQPHGPLAQAARDRLFELALRSRDGARIREAAAAYLEQSPDGAHAAQARAVGAESESPRR